MGRRRRPCIRFLVCLAGRTLGPPRFPIFMGIGVLSVLAHCAVDYPIQQEPALAGWFFIFLGASAAAARKPRTRRTAALKLSNDEPIRYRRIP